MPKINNSGVNIYYEHYVNNDQLPTVVLSNGYGATLGMWRDQIPGLAAVANIIIWDYRGHGQSDSPADGGLYSAALTLSDLAMILDECGVERAVVGGLSLGGYISLAFNLAYPKRTQALMLFDTGPGYKSDAARDKWNRMTEKQAQRIENKGLEGLGDGNEVKVSKHRSAQGLANASRGILAQVDDRVIQSLPHITVPTLVLVGALDKGFLSVTDYMAEKIPNSQKVILAEAGHAANIDQPEAFNARVSDFVKSIL